MARRKVTVTTKKKPEDTPVLLLKKLLETYDFGPTMNARIDKMAVLPPADPLMKPPKFILDGLRQALPVIQKGGNWDTLRLGHVDGHDVEVRRYHGVSKNLETRFIWGCRSYYQEAKARHHWRGNVSIHSGRTRAHAAELLDFVAAVAKHRGWSW